MRTFLTRTRSDSKKFCRICGRIGHEDEVCAALPITFTWKYGGNEVYLISSFNQWQVKLKMLKDEKDQVFKIQLPLAPATYHYKFIVDGVWKHDPEEPTVSDGGNQLNNVVEVKPANFSQDEDSEQEDYLVCIKNSPDPNPQYRVKKICYDMPALWVSIKGSWDNWKDEIVLKKYKNNFTGFTEFYLSLKIAPGTYQFMFLVDGDWSTSMNYPTIQNSDGSEVNLLCVPACSSLTCQKPKSLEEKTYLSWRREENRWTECGKIAHTFQGHSLNVVCDVMYIFGGIINGKFTNTLYKYNTKTNEFALVEDQSGDIPEPRAFHNTTVFGTKILVYGGFNQQYLTDYHSFNTLTHNWVEGEIDGEGPSPRERSTLASFTGDKLVHFGGYYCSQDMEIENYFNDVHVLNLTFMEWIHPEVEGDVPQPRYAHTANFVKGKMYVFGGMTYPQQNLNDIWCLRPAQTGPFQWKKIEAKGIAPEPRHGHSAAVADTNIIFFGGIGNNQDKLYDDLFIFDCINELWYDVCSILKAKVNNRVHPKVGGIRPTPRYYHSSVALNGGTEIVIFGGIRKKFINYPRMYILETNCKAEFEEIQEKGEEEDAHKAS